MRSSSAAEVFAAVADSPALGCGKTRQDPRMWAHLPCPNLLELHLCKIAVQLGVSSHQPGVMFSCTQLTKLQLHDCSLLGTLQIIGALSAMPGLQQLELVDTVPGRP